MKDLLKLFETVERKKMLGTLVLGRGRNSFEVFFEDDLLYIPGQSFLEKIDLDGMIDIEVLGTKVTAPTIDNLAVGSDLSKHIFPEVLYARSHLSDDEFHELARRQLHEELFERLQRNSVSFHFHDGHVPDTLIGLDGVTTRYPISLQQFSEILRQRLEQLEVIEQLIPSEEEVFVITEKGMAKKQEGGLTYGARKILELLDGFRTLKAVIADGFLFSYYVHRQIAELMVEGWIRKTLLPEINGIELSRVTEEEAIKLIPYYKNAIKYGTDELKAREGYATLAERLNHIEDAVIQFNFIGDTLYQMGRKSLAIRAYQKGLTLKKGDPMITDKIIRIYKDNAEDALKKGKAADAAALYRKALQIHPDNRDIIRSLLDLHISRRQVQEIAELCDQAASACREQNCPDFAIEMFEHIFEHFSTEPLFRKKLINLYLDFNMTMEAADEMDRLARHYLENGKSPQAMDLIDKVLRIDPNRRELRKLSKGATRVRKRQQITIGRSILTKVFIIALLVITGYQVWAYMAFKQLASKRYSTPKPVYALEDVDVVESVYEINMLALANEAKRYIDEFPFSMFKFEAEKLQKEFKDGALQVERLRNHKKKVLIEKAHRLFQKREDAEALIILDPLRKLPKDDPWRQEAEAEIRRYHDYESEAKKLRQLADEARGKKDFHKAHEIYEKLLSEYPSAAGSRGIKFPVQINIIPPDLRGGLSRVPEFLELRPHESRKYSFQPQGYEPLNVAIKSDGGPYQPLYFQQLPLWTKKVSAYGGFPLRITKKRLIYVDQEGNLQVHDLATSKSIWKYSTPPLISPSAAVLIKNPYMFFPLNNSQILKFRLNGDSNEEGKLEVDGFIQTPLVLMKNGKSVLFGTSRKNIIDWKMTTRDHSETIPLPETPIQLATCCDMDILVLGESGAVYRVNRRDKSIIWKSRIRDVFVRGPLYMGSDERGTVILLTKSQELIGLDAMSGNIQWRRPKKTSNRSTAILTRTQRILITEGDRNILEIDPHTNRTLKIWTVSQLICAFAEVVEFDGSLGFICRDGGFMLVGSQSLLPKWRYRQDGKRIRSAAYNGSHLILVDEEGLISAFKYPLD